MPPHTFSHHVPVVFVAAEPSDFESLVALRIEAMRESLERIGRFDPVRARERFLSGSPRAILAISKSVVSASASS